MIYKKCRSVVDDEIPLGIRGAPSVTWVLSGSPETSGQGESRLYFRSLGGNLSVQCQ